MLNQHFKNSKFPYSLDAQKGEGKDLKEGKQKLGKIEREKKIQKEKNWEILGTFQWDFFCNVII